MFKLAVPLLLAVLATIATPAIASAEEIGIADPAQCHRVYVVLEPVGQPGALVCRPKP